MRTTTRLMLPLAAVLVLLATAAGAQSIDYLGMPWTASEGDWGVENGRLVQRDPGAARAKISAPVPQSGAVEYQFDVRYVGGAEDGHAAFGMHFFVDDPARGRAYGNGDSFLLWATYDPQAYGGSGAWAQLYESRDAVAMDRYQLDGRDYHLEIPADYLRGLDLDGLEQVTVPMRVRIDANSGVVMVKDPLQEYLWWSFPLGRSLDERGWLTLRTSSLAASFGNLRMVPIDRSQVRLR